MRSTPERARSSIRRSGRRSLRGSPKRIPTPYVARRGSSPSRTTSGVARRRASGWHRRAACSISRRRTGTRSCSRRSGSTATDSLGSRTLPLWPDAACSNAGAGCTTRERAALMVGTSGAFRVLYESERAQPKPGLFLYLADDHRVVEGGALSDGGNLYAWIERTLADATGSLARRDPSDHGLVFLPFLGGERSTGWNPDARGTVHGLTFARRRSTCARPPTRASRSASPRSPTSSRRCKRSSRPVPGCSTTATGSRSWPTPSRCRSTCQACRRPRSAAPRCSCSNAQDTRSGTPRPAKLWSRAPSAQRRTGPPGKSSSGSTTS